MFNFLDMFDNYEDRKVDRFEQGRLIVDTCAINDSDEHEYETAVQHPDCNEGEWIIVEGYETEEEAQIGHNKWVSIMTTDPLPDTIKDNGTSYINLAVDGFGNEWREYKREGTK